MVVSSAGFGGARSGDANACGAHDDYTAIPEFGSWAKRELFRATNQLFGGVWSVLVGFFPVAAQFEGNIRYPLYVYLSTSRQESLDAVPFSLFPE